jgi:hypothetical protein
MYSGNERFVNLKERVALNHEFLEEIKIRIVKDMIGSI